ncbi:unnamed protein product [Euphydryas editha]|uniref:Uncharacterized protein n=1 Tax=Euphydryas editha TaxID=104508 RepID=A0AAU9V777_EUPED|nr:unnamed protein product [Euphydryas editha]
MTKSGGEALPSILFVPLPPGGPLPRPPRQQHKSDRRNPPLPLDFLFPSGVEPATGVPSPSLCCAPGDDPITNINVSFATAKYAEAQSLIRRFGVKTGFLKVVCKNVIAATRFNCLPQFYSHNSRIRCFTIHSFRIGHYHL